MNIVLRKRWFSNFPGSIKNLFCNNIVERFPKNIYITRMSRAGKERKGKMIRILHFLIEIVGTSVAKDCMKCPSLQS